MLQKLFALRGELPEKQSILIRIMGLVLLVLLWNTVCVLELAPASLLPTPWSVVTSFDELLSPKDALLRNLAYSLQINVLGYVEAIIVSIPIGFMLGLFPFLRELFRQPIDAARFLPLTLLTGVFISWFGIATMMKIQFLAFCITVYLLPVVIQEIEKVEQVYCDTAFTLGASSWQTIQSVFIPAVLRRVSDSIKVLVAISWTYVIFAEAFNRADGGIGALAFISARQSRIDKVFAILLVMVTLGYLQDRFLDWADRLIFPHKLNLGG